MGNLTVVMSPASLRDLKKLTRQTQIAVVKKLDELKTNPRPRGVERIQGQPDFLRIKVGSGFRVIYHILQGKLIVPLVIRDRKNAYRNIGDLKQKLESALPDDVVEVEVYRRKRGKG